MARALDAGGSERQLTVMAKALDRSRFEPHVGAFFPHGMRGEELARAGVPVVEFPVHSLKSVSAASGRYTVIRSDEVGIGKSEDLYWKYETYLKVQESELDSMLGAHGHLHAIRRDLYPYPAPGTINDDYVIPVSVLATGHRAVYERRAIVYEEAREMTGFGRRMRVMAGNLQQLREIKGLLRPFQPLPLFFFLSHKVSRLLVPIAMIVALASNLLLISSPFYSVLFWIQAAFYMLAIAGSVVRLRPKLLLLPYYFSMINAAFFFGLYHTLTSRRHMAWK